MADFVFADDYRLGRSPARQFYELFLKGYVHKHNNLTGVIQGFSSLILYEEGVDAGVRESAEQMQASARQATELNREVLAASGCARCEPSAVRLGDALAYWRDKCGEICTDSGASLSFQAPEALPPVFADSARLGEILFHLVRNAAEASGAGAEVSVELRPPGEAGMVDLLVRNGAADLDEAALRRCFLPFESSKTGRHFGLGLTTAAVLAGDMGMRLGLRSEGGVVTAWLAMPTA
jgi:signal transduction histidine kinase